MRLLKLVDGDSPRNLYVMQILRRVVLLLERLSSSHLSAPHGLAMVRGQQTGWLGHSRGIFSPAGSAATGFLPSQPRRFVLCQHNVSQKCTAQVRDWDGALCTPYSGIVSQLRPCNGWGCTAILTVTKRPSSITRNKDMFTSLSSSILGTRPYFNTSIS